MGENFGLGPEISQLASRQHGNITTKQLLALGLNDNAIDHRVRSGLLHRVHHGVYAVGRPAKMPLERAAAAVLACGPTAVLSHQSALSLWGLAKTWSFPLHVTIREGDRRPKGLIVHRSHTLARQHTRPQLGIWTTTPARTILDCAAELSDRQLKRAINNARLAGLLTPQALTDAATRKTAPRLQRLNLLPGNPTRSGLEDDFATFCQRHDLPTPQTNVKVCGFEVDAYFPEHRVIVELDSWKYHQTREAFQRDRQRDRITTAAGLITVRLTDDCLTKREATELKAILASR